MIRSNTIRPLFAIMFAGASFTLAGAADASGIHHFGNAANGGTVAVSARGMAGNGHTTTKNADGSTTVNSAGGFTGIRGATGSHQTSTTANPDGSFTRSGSASASGANGSVQTTGGFSRSATGAWSGSRSTTATNKNTGTSYSGSTTIDPTTGKPVHTGTCTNAAGTAVACK